ncbi:unnamed protein product [Adineta steineri]|uniref:Uncharacterized protein n=1 Tax=Adineta steineri TaxID=433720 RepID=A0A820D1Y8_9BILA|nr:unnamed protein product [Adineta steineri]
MFITIISDNFRVVRNNLKFNHNHDQHIVRFMFNKVQRWTKIGHDHQWREYEERDQQMRDQYYDPIESFPDKIDQLLDSLNRLYLSQQHSLKLKRDSVNRCYKIKQDSSSTPLINL